MDDQQKLIQSKLVFQKIIDRFREELLDKKDKEGNLLYSPDEINQMIDDLVEAFNKKKINLVKKQT